MNLNICSERLLSETEVYGIPDWKEMLEAFRKNSSKESERSAETAT